MQSGAPQDYGASEACEKCSWSVSPSGQCLQVECGPKWPESSGGLQSGGMQFYGCTGHRR